MKITYKGDYALKTVLDLAVYAQERVVTINELGSRIDAPIKFLEQILLDLKRGGFVESKRGPVGGYSLAKPAFMIKLGEVIRYIDGPIEPIACVGKKYSGCADIHKCVFKKIWQEVTESTEKIVNNITFGDLAENMKKQEEAAVYQI